MILLLFGTTLGMLVAGLLMVRVLTLATVADEDEWNEEDAP